MMGYRNGRQDLSLPERKNVRFEVRVKIHEFEKYLDNMDDNWDQQADESSDNDNNESDFDPNSRNND